jgi:hypothetical protein
LQVNYQYQHDKDNAVAISKIRVTVPHAFKETFRRLSDHDNLKDIVDQVTTSKLIKKSEFSDEINGLGAVREITFKGDVLTEEVVAWMPPVDDSNASEKNEDSIEAGYDYKVVAGKRTIADHLGVIRIRSVNENTTQISWDIHLKVPLWATGEIAAYFVCRTMEKEITDSLIKNMC